MDKVAFSGIRVAFNYCLLLLCWRVSVFGPYTRASPQWVTGWRCRWKQTSRSEESIQHTCRRTVKLPLYPPWWWTVWMFTVYLPSGCVNKWAVLGQVGARQYEEGARSNIYPAVLDQHKRQGCFCLFWRSLGGAGWDIWACSSYIFSVPIHSIQYRWTLMKM